MEYIIESKEMSSQTIWLDPIVEIMLLFLEETIMTRDENSDKERHCV